MAITARNIDSGVATINATSFTTNSKTPVANRLYLLSVTTRTNISTDPNQPTVTGQNLTWVAINSVVYDTTGASRKRVTLFRALGSSPSTGQLTVDFAGQTQTDQGFSLDEFSGVNTTGTNGSGAIVQSAVASDPSGTGTSLTATLLSFSSTNNMTFGACADGNSATVGTGFTALVNLPTPSGGVPILTEYKVINDTTVDYNSAGTFELGIVAVEIAASRNLYGNIFSSVQVGNGMSRNEGAT